MIVFLGDSFTWGQGLQIPYWLQQGKSIDECNSLMPPHYPAEIYDYHADEYRKKHHFPNLVAKRFNKSYSTKFGNGGSNENIRDIIRSLGSHMDTSGIDFFIIQFTELSRDVKLNELISDTKNFNLNSDTDSDFFKGYAESVIDEISNTIFDYYGKPWYGFSWREDIGEILEKKYRKNYISIQYDNKQFNNFDYLIENYAELTLAKQFEGITDGHLNSIGQEVLANSIIRKIENLNIY
jgi:hypothetical protein